MVVITEKIFCAGKNLQVTRHEKYSYFTFVGDFRHGTRNYFYRSFLLKTLLPQHCLQKIITEHKPDRLDTDLLQSFRRRLNELTDSGVVRKIERAGKIFSERVTCRGGRIFFVRQSEK